MKIYREDDWKAEVEVVKDESDETWEKYTLKVLRTVRESRMFNPTPDGTVFNVDKRRGMNYGGMWTLRDK